jgi:hypothetical protein
VLLVQGRGFLFQFSGTCFNPIDGSLSLLPNVRYAYVRVRKLGIINPIIVAADNLTALQVRF